METMGCKEGRCKKTLNPQVIFIVMPSLEAWPTKAKDPPCPYKVRLNLGFIHFLRMQNFPKNISYPLIRTRMCPYQGVKYVSFAENFAYVLKE